MNATPKKRLRRRDIAAALKASGGGVYLAARQLACDPKTVYRHMDADPTLKQLVEDLRAEMIDIGETALKRAVIAGEAWAVCFTLKTLGKSRGYVERTEHTGASGEPITIKVVYGDDGTTDTSTQATR